MTFSFIVSGIFNITEVLMSVIIFSFTSWFQFTRVARSEVISCSVSETLRFDIQMLFVFYFLTIEWLELRNPTRFWHSLESWILKKRTARSRACSSDHTLLQGNPDLRIVSLRLLIEVRSTSVHLRDNQIKKTVYHLRLLHHTFCEICTYHFLHVVLILEFPVYCRTRIVIPKCNVDSLQELSSILNLSTTRKYFPESSFVDSSMSNIIVDAPQLVSVGRSM